MSDHLVFSCAHAHYKHDNLRALWLGRLIHDIRPDVVVNLGDTFDMPSLSSYDRGKKSFQGRSYLADVSAGIDFNDKLWSVVRAAKKRMPRRVFIFGNHEQRIERAVELQPELEGTVGYDDLNLTDYYTDIVPYSGSTPGTIEIDGITYSHYLVSGVAGRPISGDRHAYSLLAKKFRSCTVGHSHTLDFSLKTAVNGDRMLGLVAGCYHDYPQPYAGNAGDSWWPGVVLCKGVDKGAYDPEFISLASIKREYAGVQ